MSTVALGIPVVPRPDATGAAPRPADDPGLVDRWGRRARDLRVSLTDRCNLRCSYCMPPEGLPWLPDPQLLQAEETLRLVRVAVERLGVDEVRFTGGEPLLRQDLPELVAGTAALRTPDGRRVRTALTTNGVGLDRRAARLAAAGLDRVTVSLDTLDRGRYERITHRDRLAAVLRGIDAALTHGLDPVKVNALVVRGVNDDETPELVRWACALGVELRVIEHMPLDAHGDWDRSAMVTAEEVLGRLRAVFRLAPVGARGSAPAERWYVEEGGRRLGTVGVIASVTRPFCGDCDRVRLTADGQVRNCLFAAHGTDLRGLLRGGADDETLAEAWRGDMWAKRAGHGIDDPSFVRPDRPMSAIGG
ncbi:GTP 3',8-cyclase MoaA [Aquipuribacter nitratireducens]|uniref:GTP 3',8-cyclase n=1 Tax=Aquipuribacter nitratireducens TaxID=650104 RepID=A0ABW0GM50_9MICO